MPVSVAVLVSAARSCAAVYSGCCCLRIAAAPATCGVAIDVPLLLVYAPSPSLSAERAAVTSLPGPERSGFSAPERVSGPWLEKYDSSPLGSSTEPTVRALAAEPGVPIVSGAPALPAATTKRVPVCSATVFSASARRSSPSDASDEPRLIETIGARWPAHSMASMIHESWP